MRVAVAQLNSGDDRPANLARIAAYAEAAAGQGAEILMLPEACAYRGAFRPDLAEGHDGPTLSAIGAAAARHRLAVLAGGLWLRSSDPLRPYNAAIFLDEAGAVLGTYRKVHLFRIDHEEVSEDEAAYTTAGRELVTVSWHSVVFGLSICYDLRFPELYRSLAAAGADVLCVPSNFSAYTGPYHWATLLRARAIENQCYVAAPAQTGIAPDGFASHGHSLVADPWGVVLAEADEPPGLVIAALTTDRVAECRAVLNSRPRPEVYGLVRHRG